MIWKGLNLPSLLQHAMRSNVADGSKADIGKSRSDDRFVPLVDMSNFRYTRDAPRRALSICAAQAGL